MGQEGARCFGWIFFLLVIRSATLSHAFLGPISRQLQTIITTRHKAQLGDRVLLRLGVAASWHRPNFVLWRKMVTAALVGWSSCPDLDMVVGPLPSLGSGSAPDRGWKQLLPNLADKPALEALTSEAFLGSVPPMIEALPQHLKDLLPALPAEGSSTWRHWGGGFPAFGALESSDARQPLAPGTLSGECSSRQHCAMFLDLHVFILDFPPGVDVDQCVWSAPRNRKAYAQQGAFLVVLLLIRGVRPLHVHLFLFDRQGCL